MIPLVFHRALAQSAAALAVTGAVTLILGAAPAAMAAVPGAGTTGGACATGSGVTVVVDFTDLGGQVEVSCAASDFSTGRRALVSAGFTATDSQPGFICTINAMPDPCPKSYQGSYWSYWHAAADGKWVSYQVGADASHPAAGALEGWRYNDGSTGPRVTPAAALRTAPVRSSATATPSATSGKSEAATSPAGEALAVGLGALLLAIIGVTIVLVRRRATGRAE